MEPRLQLFHPFKPSDGSHATHISYFLPSVGIQANWGTGLYRFAVPRNGGRQRAKVVGHSII